jgi:DNA repair photolyase
MLDFGFYSVILNRRFPEVEAFDVRRACSPDPPPTSPPHRVPRVRRSPGPRLGVRDLLPVRMGTMQLTRTGGRAGGQAGGTLPPAPRTATKGTRLAVQLPLLPAAPAASLPVLDHRDRGTDFVSLPVRSVLNPPESTGMPFWSINPYVGCEFGCSYCYARETHRWVTERAEKAETTEETEPASALSDPSDLFEHRIYVKKDITTVLAKTLDPARVGTTPIVIGTATDPYQPAERRFLVTRRILETFRGFKGLTICITTKSSLVARDAGLLAELAKKHDVSVNLSIATVDPVLLRQLEPRTPLPHARLRALKRLTSAGIEAGVLIAPILPGLTDGWTSLANLMEAAKEAGARFAIGHALLLGSAARARFLPLLERDFPKLAPRYHQHFGSRKQTRQEYQKALKRRLRLLQDVYGFDRSE